MDMGRVARWIAPALAHFFSKLAGPCNRYG